jgi:prephenate dehydrogenase
VKRTTARAADYALLGTGLIGTSIGLALRSGARRGTKIAAWDPSARALRISRSRGAFTRKETSAEDAIRGARVILAAPLDVVVKSLDGIIRVAGRGALIIDVAGVKKPVVAAAVRALRARPDVLFVSGHPMAGKETSGPAGAERDLFDGSPFVLVAPKQARRNLALAKAATFARRLNAIPVVMTAQAHDRAVAATSALPQLVSLALAMAVDLSGGRPARSVAGPGYRDSTRLARSPFALWRPVIAANGPAIGMALRAFDRALGQIRRALDRGDGAALGRLFSHAAAARRRVAGV